MNILILLTLAGMLALSGAPAAAQLHAPAAWDVVVDAPARDTVTETELTLEEAVQAALEGNRGLGAAEARADAAALGAAAADGFLVPAIQATAGAVRTDDPVGVFGTKLRQRRFTQADFDVAALNDPEAVTDWTAGVSARWDIARWDRWAERSAGRADHRAASAVLDRTREGTAYRARVLYVAAVRADASLQALEAAETSAVATAERVRRRLDEGMATQADLLQAEAAVAGIRARIEHARAAVVDAREELGSWLGWPAGHLPVPAEGTGDLVASADTAIDAELMERGDLRAGRAGVDAARARARAVDARRLPTLQAFGQLGTHAAGIGDSREANWTVGVQLSVPVFTGFSLSRGAEAADARSRALELEQAQREHEAETQVRSARRGIASARAALASARAASDAAAEAARLLRRRYEEGMATVADLLQAEARAAELSAARVDAEADLSMALVTLDFVLGTGPAAHREDR